MSSVLNSNRSFRLREDKSIGGRARDAIIELIAREKLTAGDKLPSEEEMSALFNISRPTLREALKLLEQEGLIWTKHGRGRFLSGAAALQVERPITAYEGVTSLLQQLGYKPETRVISIREEAASKDAARALRCRAGTPVICIERVRSQGNDPLIYCVEIVRRDSVPADYTEADFLGSLNELLGRQGKRPRMSSASVSAIELPDAIRRVIGQAHRGPWLLITETCLTDEGEPVVYARDYHRGDIFSFNFSRR